MASERSERRVNFWARIKNLLVLTNKNIYKLITNIILSELKMSKYIEKLLGEKNYSSISDGYRSAQDLFELLIKKKEHTLSPDELRRLQDVDSTGRDFFINYGFGGFIGAVCYKIRHPVKAVKGAAYFMYELKR